MDTKQTQSGMPTPAAQPPTLKERRAVRLQYLLPKQALTILAGRLANWRAGALTTWAIRRFVQRYGVDMSEAAEPDVRRYPTFNQFFVRALRPGARPLADAALVCPVDGAVSQLGAVQLGEIFQAKGHHYTALALLGGDANIAAPFHDGQFVTIYLSPRDYHRIHMPCDGRLVSMTHIPGDLFSVNPATASEVPGLFARNERVVCLFDSPAMGRFALVLVGATIVGSMGTVWHGLVNAKRGSGVQHFDYGDDAPFLRQGEEMGRFQLGSTVVLLFEPGRMTFDDNWHAALPVRLGQKMGDLAQIVAQDAASRPD